MATKAELKKSMKEDRKAMENSLPLRNVSYQVDTIPYKDDAAAYFTPSKNTITQNYVVGQDNTYNQSRSVLAHEQKHKDNHKLYDSDNVPMSLEQHYKIDCYDEISANITQLLQVREEYLAAKTPAEKEKIAKENSKFDYYFKAIKEGKIKPEANSEQEMRFIAVETQKMWMDKYADSYNSTHTSMTEYSFNHSDYKNLKQNDTNYNKVRKAYMTIGGVDFSKYVKDIPCINEDVKKADKLISKSASREQVIKTLNHTSKTVKIPAKIDTQGLSSQQAYEVARQQMFVENFMANNKEFFKGIDPSQLKKEKDIITFAMKEYAKEIQKDPELKAEWEKAEQELAKRVTSNKFNLSNTDTLPYEYKKRQDKASETTMGINLQDYCNVRISTILPKTKTPDVIKNPYKIETVQQSSYIPDKNAQYPYTSYQGKPQYTSWSPDHRVSKPQQTPIYDFNQPYLKDRMNEADKQRAARQQTKQTMKDQSKAANNKIKATKESEKAKKDVKSKNQPNNTNKKQNQTKQTTLTPAQIAAKKKQNQK